MIRNGIQSAIKKKKNAILPFVTTWMDIEGIIQSEISQTEKDKYCVYLLSCEGKKNKTGQK